jgi:hypothetical protein
MTHVYKDMGDKEFWRGPKPQTSGKSTVLDSSQCLTILPNGLLARTSQTGLLVSQQNRQPCAVLFIYTDGITEANNAAGEEFGESRLV